MTGEAAYKDLVLLVADGNMRFAADGLLSRPEALGIGTVTRDIFVHPHRDPGCLLNSADFLRPFVRQHCYALVMLDLHGCGRDHLTREAVEAQVEDSLYRSGWEGRAAAVVIDPELEAWVWSDSPEVASALGWARRDPDLPTWLIRERLLEPGSPKPPQPKETMERALRVAGKARSSSLFWQLAQTVSFRRCADPAFAKFKTTLQRWFPQGT